MQRNNIDNRIAEARSNAFANQYQNALRNNDYLNAGFALSRLASTDPRQASALMAMYPNAKDMFNDSIHLRNALMANQMKKEAAERDYKFKDKQQQEKFAHDMKKLYEQGKINAMLENIKSNLRTDELRREFDFKFRQASALYGEEEAAKMVVDSMFGNNRGGKGGKGGKADADGMTPKEREWYNKLRNARMYAYQSMGDITNPGANFTDEENHNVEEYRQMLMDYKNSPYADDDDVKMAEEELAKLEQTYNAIQKVYENS